MKENKFGIKKYNSGFYGADHINFIDSYPCYSVIKRRVFITRRIINKNMFGIKLKKIYERK